MQGIEVGAAQVGQEGDVISNRRKGDVAWLYVSLDDDDTLYHVYVKELRMDGARIRIVEAADGFGIEDA